MILITQGAFNMSKTPAQKKKLFVLFCHHLLPSVPETIKQDKSLQMLINHFNINGNLAPIIEDIKYLSKILQPKGSYEGFAFLFVAPGWVRALKLLNAKTKQQLDEQTSLYHELSILKEILNTNVSALDKHRIRFVTAHHFYYFLKSLKGSELGKGSHKFLAGGGATLYYDGPKLIESAIRIANIGRRVPILRFDDDVLFHGIRKWEDEHNGLEEVKENMDKTLNMEVEETQKSIWELCKAYEDMGQKSEVSHFMFSGHYGGTKETCDIDEFTNNFAIRTGLLAPLSFKYRHSNEEKVREVNFVNNMEMILSESAKDVRLNGGPPISVPEKKPDEKVFWNNSKKAPYYERWDTDQPGNTVTGECIDFGINYDRRAEPNPDFCRNFLENLYKVGANPYAQVISGAGLCLNDSAILDLPPFSNMKQNVMWIDDHLKHSLHHELRHFGWRRKHSLHGRIENASFKQLRFLKKKGGPKLNDEIWLIKNYMPRLLLGCIVDSWLRGSEYLKTTFDTDKNIILTNRLRDPSMWQEGDEGKEKTIAIRLPYVYAREYQNAILKVWGKSTEIDQTTRKKIGNLLWECAVLRLKKFCKTYKDIAPCTFFDLYLKGYNRFPVFRNTVLPAEMAEDGLIGVVNSLNPKIRLRSDSKKLTRKKEDPKLYQAIDTLIEDFIDYINLTIMWKEFVQLLRLLLNWSESSANVDWLLPGDRGKVE
jgi:hypothetical protein